eukprot:Hpha_TRINITY_DN5190_c0_g1::TRINITY_DN5190_c0_g1_i1::g.192938::m.192938
MDAAGGTSQLLTSLLPLGVLLLVNRFDIEKEGWVPGLRIAYGAVSIAIAVIYVLIFFRIRKGGEGGRVQVPEQKVLGSVVAPAEAVPVSTYDMGKLRELFTQLVIGGGVMSLMHFKWGHTTPLVLQLVMLPTQLFQAPLFQIYIMGKEAEGPLSRPFPEKKMFNLPTAPAAEEETTKDAKGKKKVKAN